MNREKVQELLKTEQYSFLRDSKYLGDNISLLALGGSIAYGTNTEKSDVDLRGFAIDPVSQLVGLTNNFEQVVETETDTTIYSLTKMIQLLINCNPNIIEILGLKPEHYIYVNKYGQAVLDNKNAFLSKKTIDTFGGYANQQFNRMQHALLGNGQLNDKKLEMLKHSLECAISAFDAKHKNEKLDLSILILDEQQYIDRVKRVRTEKIMKKTSELEKELRLAACEEDYSKIQSLTALYYNDIEKINKECNSKIEEPYNEINDRILISGRFNRYSIGNIQSILSELSQIKNTYGQINKRNTKKTPEGMSKHMMHLIRLYLTGKDLNEGKGIVTYREKEHDMLMSIRNGDYLTSDKTKVKSDFYDLLASVQKEYEYSIKHTVLPDNPDMDTLTEMMQWIYADVLNVHEK